MAESQAIAATVCGPADLTVLIVDDSRLQRRILVSSLNRWGYRILQAATGEEALSICRSHSVDLVISDWVMPGMSGLELCRVFRDLPRESYGYFILLTSKSDKGEVAEGLDVGADDFLSKPVNGAELRARLRAGERILSMERELSQKNALLGGALSELQKLYASIDRDLIEARQLQQSLVRNRHQVFQGVEVSLLLRPAGHVGGDLVGILPGTRRELGIFAIDVSGHGIASALMTARLASYLSGAVPGQSIALTEEKHGRKRIRAPAEVAHRLNELVLNEMDTELYFTLALARIDLITGEVVMTQAGHPHPAVQRAGGEIEYLGEGGLPIGLLSGAEYTEVTTVLLPGDRLLLCSDGITECSDATGAQLGEDGLTDVIKRNADLMGETFFEAMLWDLANFSGDREFGDDVSAVLLDYRAAESA